MSRFGAITPIHEEYVTLLPLAFDQRGSWPDFSDGQIVAARYLTGSPQRATPKGNELIKVSGRLAEPPIPCTGGCTTASPRYAQSGQNGLEHASEFRGRSEHKQLVAGQSGKPGDLRTGLLCDEHSGGLIPRFQP